MDDEFDRFVRDTGPRLHRSAVLLCGDPHLAEDLLQTTYTRLFTAWRRVRRAGNPVAYAHTTLTHVFLSHRAVRRNGERPVAEVYETAVPFGVGDATDDPTDHLDRLDLLTALRTLDPLDRAVVVLRYLEDRPVREVAGDLGLTEQAVRNRASRALARLRPLLDRPSAPTSQEPR